MAKKIRVLYLDDEENNLRAFKSFFRKDYDVFTAVTAGEAFELLKTYEMHIIVTDQKMPEITGVEFLEQTTKTHPDAIRLLITGYSDLSMVIDAINKGQINKYIEKPWDWDMLNLMMENCVDLYQSRREIRIKNIELQKTNDELNRFIYSASHDLRSPLTSILGIVQLAKMEENLSNDYIDIIETNILKMDRYIKNIITYYQNSKAEQTLEKINFKEIIEEEIDLLQDHVDKFTFDVEINQPTDFRSDFFRIQLIINNIISNAIKYKNSENSEHFIGVKVDTDSEKAVVKISDNGIGIHEDHIKNIFKMFYRAQATSNKQGSGIGLFIVKESLEKIEGTIHVESTPMVGSSFEIIIPNKSEQKNDE